MPISRLSDAELWETSRYKDYIESMQGFFTFDSTDPKPYEAQMQETFRRRYEKIADLIDSSFTDTAEQ
jgi:hypothetical protein